MIDELDQALTADLGWREAELGSLKLEISNADKGSIKQRALLRAIWAMLYAHYEGFSVFAWTTYLETFRQINVARCKLPDELIALSLEKEFRMAKNNLTSLEMLRFFRDDLKTLMDERAVFPQNLEADSNLWPKLYRSNCQRAALPHKNVDKFETRLNLLVRRRNGIAHGESVIVKDLAEYQTYEDTVLLVVHELALAVIDSISAHLRQSGFNQMSLGNLSN